MSLDKGIKHGKEKRKPYRKAKAFDASCRNHGGCPWCEASRTRKSKVQKKDTDEDINESD
jgi:hypothetical protein